MDPHRFVEPRLGFTLTKPASWQFVPPAWSPARELAAAADPEAPWRQFGHLAFCGALRPHANRQQAFSTLQVMARPLPPPSAGEAAAMLRTIRDIVLNQNPRAEILDASTGTIVAGCQTNVLRCRFTVPVEIEQQRVPMGVISRSLVIFAPRYAFTVGLSSSDDPAHFDEAEFDAILASIRIA